MKQINVYFDDDDYNKLVEKKGKISWKDFILWMLEVYNERRKSNRNTN